ncbi:MAG: hypothetical protein WAO12_12045 [Venatoribacter sp.]
MKMNKLISKLNHVFNKRAQQQLQDRLELQEALLLIKKKQKELKACLEECTDPEERKALQEKITILQAQRGKGIGKLRNPD